MEVLAVATPEEADSAMRDALRLLAAPFRQWMRRGGREAGAGQPPSEGSPS